MGRKAKASICLNVLGATALKKRLARKGCFHGRSHFILVFISECSSGQKKKTETKTFEWGGGEKDMLYHPRIKRGFEISGRRRGEGNK